MSTDYSNRARTVIRITILLGSFLGASIGLGGVPAYGAAPVVSLTPGVPVAAVAGCPSGARGDIGTSLLPVDAAFIEDDSGSMVGPSGSDPSAQRYAATKFAVRFISGLTPGLCDRIAVIHFGARVATDRELPLTPVATAGPALDRSLLPGPPLGETRYAPAIRRAATLLGTVPNPGRLRIAVLITDGKPNQMGVPLRRELADIRSAVSDLGGAALHVLVIDRHRRFGAAQKAMWLGLGAKTVDRLSDASAAELGRALTRAIAGDLGIASEGEQSIYPGLDASVTVPPLRQSLVVTTFALHQGAVAALIAPDGSVVTQLRGQLAVAHVTDPLPGTWRLRAMSGEQVRIAVKLIAPRLVLGVTSEPWPLGRPLVVTLRSPTLDDEPDATAEVRITSALGTDISRPLVATGMAGTMETDPAIVLSQPGSYTASALVRVDGAVVAQTTALAIRVTAEPYMEVGSATIDSRRSVFIPLQLDLAGSPVDARSAFVDDPAGIAHAVVTHRDGTAEDVPVRWLGGSSFAVTSSYHPRDGERLGVRVTLGGRSASAHEVVETLLTSVRAEPTPSDLSADRERRVARIAFALTLMCLLGFAAWAVSRPRMQDRVRVGDEWVRVDGRRFVRIPGKGPRSSIWIIGARRRAGRVAHEMQVGFLPTPWPKRAKARVGHTQRPHSTGRG